MSDLFTGLKEKLAGKNMRIVFPEGLDERILTAAGRLAEEKILTPVLVGNIEEIQAKAQELNVNLDAAEIYDPASYAGIDELVASFVERRKGKATEEDARKILLDENYFGTMLVFTKKADGLVSGAVHSTADTIRPALQVIKTKPGVGKVSGSFVMVRGEEKYVFADCGVNIAPDSNDLAETAIESAKLAQLFDIDPRIAMLSFSTKGSAKSEETEKVIAAVEEAKKRDPQLIIDGELQFDAAFVPSVAQKKAPDSPLKGEATVFIFPSLDAGNISYKIAQRLGNFDALGPLLQGLNAPVNDLSRGCNDEDVYKIAIITAVQAL